jgi:hypothetical protein
MNATRGQRDMIEALCSGMIQRMLFEKAATACALASRMERSFDTMAIDCIDDLLPMTPTVERKRLRANKSWCVGFLRLRQTRLRGH